MKIQRTLLGCFETLFALFMGIILIVAITGTQRNIEWQNQIFVTAVLFTAILVLFWILRKTEMFLIRYENVLLYGFLVLWGIVLYLFCFIFKNEPAQDYDTVYRAATAFINGQEVDWIYFATFKNNFFLLVILIAVMKISIWLGLSDWFGLMLLLAVLMVIWAGRCIYGLLKKSECRTSVCFGGLILFAGFVPLWGGTYYFYTDCMSLCFGVWACYLLGQAENAKRKWLYFVLAGIVVGIGVAIKPTVIICLVAVLIVMLLTKSCKMCGKAFVALAVGFLITQIGVNFVWNSSPGAVLEEEYGAPIEFWIAIGLRGNGSHPSNAEEAGKCLDVPGKAAKKEIARDYILEHIEELWNPDHFIQKARYNFASGHMGLPDYNRYQVNVMYEFFNDYGTYGGYAIMYTSGYFYAILLFGIIGSILIIKDLLKQKQLDKLTIAVHLTVYGLFLYLMLFEANNRQLYNHMPWFALMGALGVNRINNAYFCKAKIEK